MLEKQIILPYLDSSLFVAIKLPLCRIPCTKRSEIIFYFYTKLYFLSVYRLLFIGYDILINMI